MNSQKSLMNSREMRDAYMDRVYVLNKVKGLMTIPETDYVTQIMVANYYEVSPDTIQRVTKKHESELKSDGMRHASVKDFGSRKVAVSKITNKTGGKTIEYKSGFTLDIPNAGAKVYPVRAILRIGMLLEHSNVAQAIRTALLDEHYELKQKQDTYSPLPEVKANMSAELLSMLRDDRESYMRVINEQNEAIRRKDEQVNSLLRLLEQQMGKVSDEYHSVENDKPDTTPQERMQQVAEYIRETQSDSAVWYKRINDLVGQIKRATGKDQSAVLSDAYKRLDKNYGICLAQYVKEYQEIVGRKPSTLETVYWMETEKNKAAKGMLAGVLTTMLNETRKRAS